MGLPHIHMTCSWEIGIRKKLSCLQKIFPCGGSHYVTGSDCGTAQKLQERNSMGCASEQDGSLSAVSGRFFDASSCIPLYVGFGIIQLVQLWYSRVENVPSFNRKIELAYTTVNSLISKTFLGWIIFANA